MKKIFKYHSACGVLHSTANLRKEPSAATNLPPPDESEELNDKISSLALGMIPAAALWVRDRRQALSSAWRALADISPVTASPPQALSVSQSFRAFFIRKGCTSPLDVFRLLDLHKTGKITKVTFQTALSQLKYPPSDISPAIDAFAMNGSLRLMDLVAMLGPSLTEQHKKPRKLVNDCSKGHSKRLAA